MRAPLAALLLTLAISAPSERLHAQQQLPILCQLHGFKRRARDRADSG